MERRIDRNTALSLAKVAGYHSDSKTFTRLRIESSCSIASMNQAWHLGQRAKAAGVPCDCFHCRRANAPAA